jgi:hypothetical protein
VTMRISLRFRVRHRDGEDYHQNEQDFHRGVCNCLE